MLFRKKKEPEIIPFDTANKTAVIRASICTGERVAGFRDNETRKFEEIMVIRSDEDLAYFKRTYGVDVIKTEY